MSLTLKNYLVNQPNVTLEKLTLFTDSDIKYIQDKRSSNYVMQRVLEFGLWVQIDKK